MFCRRRSDDLFKVRGLISDDIKIGISILDVSFRVVLILIVVSFVFLN